MIPLTNEQLYEQLSLARLRINALTLELNRLRAESDRHPAQIVHAHDTALLVVSRRMCLLCRCNYEQTSPPTTPLGTKVARAWPVDGTWKHHITLEGKADYYQPCQAWAAQDLLYGPVLEPNRENEQ